MRQVVYADVLVFLNTVITFFLLLTVKQFAGVKTTVPRLVTASFVGGAYSLVLLAPKMNFFLLLLAKTAMCVSITLIAFHVTRGRKMVRCLALFLGASFLYAGIMYGLNYIVNSSFITVNNGAVYYDISVYSLIGITAIVYGILFILRKKLFSVKQEDLICDLTVAYGGRTVTVKTLIDSGHSLKDVYTNQPVIVMTQNAVRELVGTKITAEVFVVGETYGSIPLRLLPISAVSGDKLLPAFTVETVTVSGTGVYRQLKNASVAVTENTLGGDEYQALVSADLF